MEERKAAFLKAAKGVCVATGATLLCMVLLALAVVFLRISDNALFLMNQLAKVASIFAGAYFAVGPGGQRGFVTGAAVGFVYMVLGYGVYWAFHGSVSAPLVMLGEMLLGAVLGALSGAVVANLRPKSGAKRHKARYNPQSASLTAPL